MKKISILFLLFNLLWVHIALIAQTNPTAVSLPFSLTGQSSATLPTGVAVHRFTSIPTTRTLSAATGDLPNQGSSPTLATGGWYHLGTDGIGILSSGTNPAGAVVVAINTTGLTNIQVSWLCKTIKNQSSRDNSIALQYRVGTSGSFINVGTTTTYSSAGMTDGHSSSTLTETLPVGAENQSVVQVRWIYWESVSTSGSRDKISVDDISITGSSSSSCATPTGISASGITTTSATISWNTVSGASSYEYAVTTSSTAPSSGTSTTSTSAAVGSLTPNTLYYAHVRTNCGGSTFSSWGTNTFTTNDSTGGDTGNFVIMTYNLLNYPGSTGSSREPSYRTIIDAVNPDIVVCQEVLQSTGANNFLSNVLNYSASNYSMATFIDGYDTDNSLYYKSAKFQFISNTAISTSLRDINQFLLKHIASGDSLYIYSVHLKAGNTSSDETQREGEVDDLRAVTDAFPAGKYFLVCGDFNIYSGSETAYQKMVTNGSNANGKFNDLLSLSGSWNNSSYAIHHTQSPRTTSFGGGATGGLDDRFDMLLFSTAITQTGGFDIVPNTYKAFGNDGQHYNQALNTPPYTMYSSTIASALHDASDHLPVVVTFTHTSGSPMLAPVQSSASNTSATGNTVFTYSSVTTGATTPSVTIYPNPATQSFTLQVNAGDALNTPLKLYDATGKLVYQVELAAANSETVKVDVSPLNLAKGIYFIHTQVSSPVKLIIE